MLSHFALRLICGTCLMLAGIPRQTISSGFFRVQMLIVLGLSVLGFLANQSFVAPAESGSVVSLLGLRAGLCIVLGLLAFFGSVFWTLERRKGATRILYTETFLSLVTLGISAVVTNPETFGGIPLLLINDLTGTLLLGGALTGMLLGHSYLTTPTMSISPLSRINLYFGIGAILKGVLCVIVLLIGLKTSLSLTSGTMLALRTLGGIVSPAILSVMTWQILKYKNTQAATGVLFVGVILTFIGELVAAILQQELHLPL